MMEWLIQNYIFLSLFRNKKLHLTLFVYDTLHAILLAP